MNNDTQQSAGKFKTIPKGKKPPLYCQECNCFTYGKTHTKGHLLIEIVLYLFLFFPGLIYTIWRHTTRQKVCTQCKAPGLLPYASTRAKKDLGAEDYNQSLDEFFKKK